MYMPPCEVRLSVHMCRPLPTRPSHYASGVLQPLRAFLDTDAGKQLQPSAQEELAQVQLSPQLGFMHFNLQNSCMSRKVVALL